MANRRIFDIIFKTKGLDTAKKQSQDLDSSFNKLATTAKAAAVSFASFQTALKGVEFAKLAATSENVRKSFGNLAKEPDKMLQAMKTATAGTISEMELMQKFNEGALLGLPLDRFDEMLTIARGAAQATGQSMDLMLSSVVTGLGRQSKLMLDNLGILIDVGTANENYAKSIGKTADQLTDQEKKQAFVNEALNAGAENLEKLGGVSETSVDKFGQLNASFEDLKVRVGDELLPVVIKITEGLTKFTNEFNVKRLEDYAVGVGTVTAALGLYTVAQQGANAAAATFKKALPVAIFTTLVASVAELNKRFREFKQEIDAAEGWQGKAFKVDELGQFRDEVAKLSVTELALLEQQLGLNQTAGQNFIILTKEMAEKQEIINARKTELLKINQDTITWAGELEGFTQLELKGMSDKIDLLTPLEEKYKEHVESQKQLVQQKEQEEMFNARLIDQYPELAEKLGLMNTEVEAQKTAWEGAKDAVGIMNDSVISLGAAGIKTGKIGKRVAQAQALVDTYAAANAAYRAALALPPPMGLFLAPVAAAAAIAAGLENVKQIEKAQHGMDRMVNEPTLVLTGEAGPERVQVTPSGRASSQTSSGVTINFLGPVTNKDFVRDTIIPEIRKVTKLGLA